MLLHAISFKLFFCIFFYREYANHYEPEKWAANGPIIITKVLQRMCNNSEIIECPFFRILEKDLLYAVPYNNWEHFFEEKYLKETLEMTRNAIGVHVWNKLSSEHLIKKSDNGAYVVLAKKYCPSVYAACDTLF